MTLSLADRSAAAAAGPAPLDTDPAPDRIFLRDLVFEAEIGAFQQERGQSQRLRASLVADLVPAAGEPEGVQDDVDRVLSYDVLLQALEAELEGTRINLLETLAEGVAARVLATGGVARVAVRLEKLDRCPGALGVEIVRDRGTAPARPLDPPPARVVVIGRDAAVAPDLMARLGAGLDGQGAVLCVDASGTAEPDLPVPVRRRIDLLGFEQAAWRLAARDERLVVVGSRTELDWSLRHDRLAVWAPGKMVVDARDGAPADVHRLPALAAWLAARLGAHRLETLGTVRLQDAGGLSVSDLGLSV